MIRRSVALLLPLLACGGAPEADDGGSEKGPAHVVAAEIGVAAAQRFVETADALGVVVPRVGHVATLSAPAATRIARVYVAAGSAVRRGDPLVDFERPTFEAAAQSANT